jgi:hypothetical protein
VSAPGYTPTGTTVMMEEGRTKRVHLELIPEPNQASEQATPESATDPSAVESRRPSKVPAYAAFAVGAAALAVGTYAGVIVARKASSLSASCGPDRVCPGDRQSDITAARQWATVSTVGFITAGVGITTGLVLLLASGGSSPPQGRRGLRPSLGLSSLSLEGTF